MTDEQGYLTSLAVSVESGSLYSAQRIFVQGPCFQSSDSVKLKFVPSATLSKANKTLEVAGAVGEKLYSVFRQPLIPDIEPG